MQKFQHLNPLSFAAAEDCDVTGAAVPADQATANSVRAGTASEGLDEGNPEAVSISAAFPAVDDELTRNSESGVDNIMSKPLSHPPLEIPIRREELDKYLRPSPIFQPPPSVSRQNCAHVPVPAGMTSSQCPGEFIILCSSLLVLLFTLLALGEIDFAHRGLSINFHPPILDLPKQHPRWLSPVSGAHCTRICDCKHKLPLQISLDGRLPSLLKTHRSELHCTVTTFRMLVWQELLIKVEKSDPVRRKGHLYQDTES